MTDRASYHGNRFPPEIISHAVWLYHRFCLSFRDTEDLLVQRGITVSYGAISSTKTIAPKSDQPTRQRERQMRRQIRRARGPQHGSPTRLE
jgi:transposase-like protein